MGGSTDKGRIRKDRSEDGAGKAAGTYFELIVSSVSSVVTATAAIAGMCVCRASGPAVCAAVIMIISFALWFMFGRLSSKHRVEFAEKSGELSSRIYQFIDGIEEIRGAGAENHVLYELMRSYVEQERLSEKYKKQKCTAAIITGLAGAIMLTLGFLTFPFTPDTAGGGGFTAFCIYAGILLECAILAGRNVKGLLGNVESVGILRKLMDQAPEYGKATEAAPAITGAIELSGVSFRYSEDTPLILDNVNLSIKAGEYVAITGPSGCGKSTLIRLLLGFIAPTSGRIYYDNRDLTSFWRAIFWIISVRLGRVLRWSRSGGQWIFPVFPGTSINCRWA